MILLVIFLTFYFIKMTSRTCLEDITCVSMQLKFFTLAELFYVLQEDKKLSLFDINRIKKITDGARYTFGSDHTYEQVATVIKLLSHSFAQALPMQNEMSLSFISHRELVNPIILPFTSVCCVCYKSLDKFDAIQRSIKIYCISGCVIPGMI